MKSLILSLCVLFFISCNSDYSGRRNANGITPLPLKDKEATQKAKIRVIGYNSSGKTYYFDSNPVVKMYYVDTIFQKGDTLDLGVDRIVIVDY